MIYIFDNELWGNGKEAVVKTEIGEVALRLERKSNLIRKKVIVYDRYHVPIGLIEKKGFQGGGMYTIYYDEQVMATISTRYLWVFKRYEINTPDRLVFKVKGSIKEHKYRIQKGKKTVAETAPDYAHRPYQYGMKTEGEKKHRYVFLCAAVAFTL